MKNQTSLNSPFSISLSAASTYFLAFAFLIYSAGLLDVIMHSDGLKIYLDIIRALLLLGFLLLTIKVTPYNSKGLMFCLYALLCVIIFHDMFILEVATGLLVAFTINKKNPTTYLKLAIIATLLVVIPAMLLAKLGIINSVVFIAPSTADNTLTAASKDAFGFWHPNQITLLVSGCLLASFYISDKKLVAFCIITYAVLLESTISRTFLPIPILIALYTALPTNNKIIRSFFLLGTFAISIIATLTSLITSLPIILKTILTPENYIIIDKILSYRLQIIERYMQDLNLFELVTGWSPIKHELDSAYINTIFSQGYLIYLAVTIGLFYIQFIAYKNKMIKEAIVISLFMLISNFETPIGASSLIFIVALLSIIRTIKLNQHIAKKRNMANNLHLAHLAQLHQQALGRSSKKTIPLITPSP